MSRWENAPTTRELARLMGEMIGIYCASYPTPPAAVTLDIDDTCDVVHGYQQLSFWNRHHGERCFFADPCLRYGDCSAISATTADPK